MRSHEDRGREAWYWGIGALVALAALFVLWVMVEGVPDRWIGVVGTLVGSVIGSVITLSCVFLTSRLTWQRQQAENQQKRAVLATIFLKEIRFLESGLQKLRRTYEPGADVIALLRTPMHDGAGTNLCLFSSETGMLLTDFYRQIHDLRAAAQHFSTLPQQDQSLFLGNAHQQKATEILEDVLPGVVTRLRREGGEDSPPLEQHLATPSVAEPSYESIEALRDDLFRYREGPTP
jgi:hypothetical protein